jgi:hypothetical protein
MKRVAALLIFLLACTPHVNRARWIHMPQSEKTLYVKSLLGAEKVKAAKGGTPRQYSRTPDEYVKRIDTAYAAGDSRDPAAILGDLRDR